MDGKRDVSELGSLCERRGNREQTYDRNGLRRCRYYRLPSNRRYSLRLLLFFLHLRHLHQVCFFLCGGVRRLDSLLDDVVYRRLLMGSKNIPLFNKRKNPAGLPQKNKLLVSKSNR